MSGSHVATALHERFHAIRRAEMTRLARKLDRLNDAERRSAESVIVDVVAALASPAATLADEAHPRTLEAIVRLFRLDLPAASR